MFIKDRYFIYALILVLAAAGCNSGQPDRLVQVKGMWRLDKYEAFDSATGQWNDAPKRIGYLGYIIYDDIGHVGVHLTPPGFGHLNSFKNMDSLGDREIAEYAKMQSKCFFYFANYKISGQQHVIEHNILSSSHPEEIGTTVRRYFEFRGDTLILTPTESIAGARTRLRWLRAR